MEKGKLVKIIKIVVTCIIVFLFLWFLFIYPLGAFNKNENKMKDAAKRYFELNTTKLPKENEVSTVELSKLYNKNYLEALYVPYTKTLCDVDTSWVKVKREKGEYKYYTYLKCGILSSNVDHNGPNVTLNGNDKIELDLNGEYKELGVKSVVDNTDGKMDVEKVQINSSNVDTSKVGTYKVKYIISDSLKNQTVKTRTVIVKKTLASIINKDTNNSGVYKGTVDNNYIRFANVVYRIMKLNKDGSVKIISDDPISFINYDGMDKWLNNYYYGLLPDSSKKYLVNSEWCDDTLDDSSVKTTKKCSNIANKKVSTLSASDYNNSIENGGTYLYNSLVYNYLSNEKDKNNAYAIVNDEYKSVAKKDNLALKVVMTLTKNLDIIDGDGTQNNPYSIGDIKRAKANTKVNERYAGEYILYGSDIYRIINSESDGSTKVIGDSKIKDEENLDVEVFYENKPYEYNPKKHGNIGYKINNELFSYLKTDYFVKHEISVPIYNESFKYRKNTSNKKYTVKLHAPDMYELFSAPNNLTADRYWFINSSKNSDWQAFIDTDNNFRNEINTVSANTGIRIVGYLNPKCVILSGEGTYNNPYVITK